MFVIFGSYFRCQNSLNFTVLLLNTGSKLCETIRFSYYWRFVSRENCKANTLSVKQTLMACSSSNQN